MVQQPESNQSDTASEVDRSNPALVARQPIFDRHGETFGYELLFCDAPEADESVHVDDNTTTVATISNTMLAIGFDRLTDGKLAFVKVTWNVMDEEVFDVLPPERTVLELLEMPVATEDLISACKRASEAGYRLALDDVNIVADIEPLLARVDFVKVDLLQTQGDRRRELFAILEKYDVKVIAQNVETREAHEECRQMGAAYFQGYFFARPVVVEGRRLSSSEASTMQLMKAINATNPSFTEIEQLIKRDATLSYQFLRYLNSAAMGIRNEVTSIKQGIALVGVKPLQKWVYLLSMTGLHAVPNRELMLTCVLRARVCELLAAREDSDASELDCFLLGLLSAFDAVIGMELAELLPQIGIRDDLQAILLNHVEVPSMADRLYRLTLACEKGDWSKVMELSINMKQNQPEIAMIYFEALDWANQIMDEVQ